MKHTSSLKRGLVKVRQAWLARQYDRAFAQTDQLLKDWPDNPQMQEIAATD